MLEVYLQHNVAVNQVNWTKFIDIAQFCFNLQKNESIDKSLLEIMLEYQLNPQRTLLVAIRAVALSHIGSPRIGKIEQKWLSYTWRRPIS